MTKEDIAETIKDIVVEQFSIDKKELLDSLSFVTDLNSDSLDVVEFVMEIEDRCGVQIPDEVVDTLQTIGQVTKYVCEHSNDKEDGNE